MMPSRRSLALLLLSLAALPAVAAAQPRIASRAESSATLGAADERALRAVAATLDDRWNARDAAGIARLFAADADFELHVDEGVRRLEGAGLRDGYQAMLDRAAPALRHRSVVDRVRAVSSGVAIADGRAWIERANADSSRTPLRAFTTATVLVRDGSGWKVRATRSHAAPLDTAAWRAAP